MKGGFCLHSGSDIQGSTREPTTLKKTLQTLCETSDNYTSMLAFTQIGKKIAIILQQKLNLQNIYTYIVVFWKLITTSLKRYIFHFINYVDILVIYLFTYLLVIRLGLLFQTN